MTGLLALGAVLGLDNMRVAAGLALAGVSRGTALRLSVAFALAETAMPVVGLVIGHSATAVLGSWANVVGALFLGGCGLYVVLAPDEEGAVRLEGPAVLLGLPIVLSLDNLAAGVGLGVLDMPIAMSALALGLMSTAMCLAGFGFGGRLIRSFPHRAKLIGGMALMLVAILTAVGA